MIKLNCLICHKEFYRKPSHVARGWSKYCSIACRTQSQFKGESVNCSYCGAVCYKAPLQLKRSKNKAYFCNKHCQTMWRNTIIFVGENHPNWKSGHKSYRRRLTVSEKTQTCKLCGTNDSRLLIVHHIDHNRQNNVLSNLVWLCWNCHYLVHHDQTASDALRNLL